MADCRRRVSPKFAIFIGNVSGAFVHNRGIFGFFAALAFAGFGVSGGNGIIFISVIDTCAATVFLVFGDTDGICIVIGTVQNVCFGIALRRQEAVSEVAAVGVGNGAIVGIVGFAAGRDIGV